MAQPPEANQVEETPIASTADIDLTDGSTNVVDGPTRKKSPPRAPDPGRTRPTLLGTHRDRRCSLVVSRDPWTFADTIVVSADRDGGLGQLGSAVSRLYRPVAGEPPQSSDQTVFEEVEAIESSSLPAGSPTRLGVVLCNVSDEPPPPSAVRGSYPAVLANAAAKAVREADRNKRTRLVMPLLGAGAIGLPAEVSADAVIPAARDALWALGPTSTLREVVFLAPDAEAEKAIRAAWAGHRAQPFANDQPKGDDLLGVKDEVEALADMLMLRDTIPPLAVGVLGGWGRGKSFVLRLMQDRMNEIRASRVVQADSWDDARSPFVGHVYPIWFNAWTFARADLWAALMQTVLKELHKQLGIERRLATPPGDLFDGSRWDDVRRLPKELENLYEATAATIQPGDDLFETLAHIHEADQRKLEVKEDCLAQKKQLRVERVQAMSREAATAKLEVPSRRYLEALGRELGLSVDATAKWVDGQIPHGTLDARATVEEARRLANQVENLRLTDWDRLRAVVRKHRGMAGLCVVAAAVVALVGVRDGLDQLGAFLVALAAAGGSFVRLVRSWLDTGTNFAADLVDWRDSLSTSIDEAERAHAEEVEHKQLVDPALKGIDEAILRAEEEVAAARHRAGLVAEFQSVDQMVDARLASNDYAQRLGAMQQISEDLSRLSESLCVADEDDPYVNEKRAQFPRGPARVVLFIDDIDRCPPDKVVEVLEAVQLLLATNLFVVVLALDLRYVTRALEKQYQGVLSADGDPSGMDYLEKIIQIPYRTRAATRSATLGFMRGQLRTAPVPAASEVSPAAPEDPAPVSVPVAEPDGAPIPAATDVAAIARSLYFTPEEIEIAASCSSMLGLSPRAAKRVTNVVKIYRMVAARTGSTRPSLDEMATIVLLAGLASAHPEVHQDALAALQAALDTTPAPPPSPGRAPASGARTRATIGAELLELTAPADDAGPQRVRLFQLWRQDLEALVEAAILTDGEATDLRFGAAALADVGPAVRFASAFCFLGDGS